MSFLSNLFHSNKVASDDMELVSPVSGVLLPISEVPDIVISEKVVGDGVAICPENGEILAPCDGVITRIIATKSAFALKTALGPEIYVTFGVGAIDLAGYGFICTKEVGQSVKKGELVLKVDLNEVEGRVKSTVTSMIVVASSAKIEKVTAATGKCSAGVTPCLWIGLKKDQ